MKTQIFASEIKVQQYVHGKPFPSLYGEVENPTAPENKPSMTAKLGIVMSRKQGLLAVEDGEYLQVSEPTGGLNEPVCIGRIPEGYSYSGTSDPLAIKPDAALS